MPQKIENRIRFDDDRQIMDVDFTDLRFRSSGEVNAVYDRIEELIADTGEEKWFFLVNYSGLRIDPGAWFSYSRRGKALNLAHSQGSVRYDVSEETRREIERAARTEAFDPNLFNDRESALKRIAELPSKRRRKIVHTPNHTTGEIAARISFRDGVSIMDADFSNLTFEHSGDVNAFYDYIEDTIAATGKKWFFLVNYENCRIETAAWVSYARRGKRLNINWSLGSVRYAPGSETEETIRMRAESQAFRPNIRNTMEEAMERIDEMKREIA